MTLPHHTGLARGSDHRPGSVEAAEAHARGGTGSSYGRIEWTPRNLAARDLLCESEEQTLIASGFVRATAEPVRRAPVGPWPVLLGDAQHRGGDTYVVKATNGEKNSEYFRVVPEAVGQYRVCGFA